MCPEDHELPDVGVIGGLVGAEVYVLVVRPHDGDPLLEKRMMNSPVKRTGMAENPFCIVLDPDLEEPIRQFSRKRGCGEPDDLVNSALRLYIATLQGAGTKGQDLAFENEILRRRVGELEQETRQKNEQISVLLKLWEQCPLNKGEREVPPEVEEKISRLLQNWYYDSERKDFSGADGGTPGRI